MSEDRSEVAFEERLHPDALAKAMPRALIADGSAERLARDWSTRARGAQAEGLPAYPRYALDPAIREGLFEARRSRQIVRGLEGIDAALEAQEQGLARTLAARPAASQRRISRLLIVSGDGSTRFYRGVDRLVERYGSRLEVVLLDCDEAELGAAVFGAGRRARALMLEHKQAVVRFLTLLEGSIAASET